jgi:hypothetical protein
VTDRHELSLEGRVAPGSIMTHLAHDHGLSTGLIR